MLAGQMEGWFYIAALLLVGAGFMKVRDPAPTSGALAAAGLPAPRPAALTLGVAEIVIGAGALLVGGRWFGGAVAAVYSGFAGFVGVALARRLPIQSCGCFGRTDTPPSWLHVTSNVAAVAGAAWYAAVDGTSLPAMLADQPLGGLPYLAFLATGVAALYLILAELPRLNALGARPT